MALFKKILGTMSLQKQEERKAKLQRDIIHKEAKIGGELFGPIPSGGRREFFCLDEHTWVWHEEWIDAQGQRHVRTTRYDVRPNGILKSQNGQAYQQVGANEAGHLRQATDLYYQRVKQEVYAKV